MVPTPRRAARTREARPLPAGVAPGPSSGAGRLISVVRRPRGVLLAGTLVCGVLAPTFSTAETPAPKPSGKIGEDWAEGCKEAASRALRINAEIKLPELVEKPEIRYPVELVDPKKRYVLQVLILEAVISETGAVSCVRILRGPRNKVSEFAIEGIRKWRYLPALKDGRPVSVFLAVTINHFPGKAA